MLEIYCTTRLEIILQSPGTKNRQEDQWNRVVEFQLELYQIHRDSLLYVATFLTSVSDSWYVGMIRCSLVIILWTEKPILARTLLHRKTNIPHVLSSNFLESNQEKLLLISTRDILKYSW
jgi:hypothetical protein